MGEVSPRQHAFCNFVSKGPEPLLQRLREEGYGVRDRGIKALQNQVESTAGTLAERVRSAVFWRSGSQIAAQMVMWGATLIVIRLLSPADYGLFAMTQTVLAFLNVLNGYSFASALIQAESVDKTRIGQAFGMLILLNVGLALAQIALAPLAAAHFHAPEVASLLRVQAILYLLTPFIALPQALLSRALDYRAQALANLLSAVAGGATALSCATAGWGVWTLVAAPIALFGTRALVLTAAARALVMPRFRFAGAESMLSFGASMIAIQVCWIVQSQSDIFIAGSRLDPHALGLYAEALFLTQIFTAKFVPPLNEVAFSAYAQLQREGQTVAGGFARAARLVMLVACPLYLGLAVTAAPLIETLFGPKWAAMAPLTATLSLAMPFFTLQILFAPATNGLGRPGIAVRSGAVGALLMPAAYLIGLRFGVEGLAWSWVAAMPVLLLATAAISLPAIGLGAPALIRAIAPPVGAALAMAAGLLLIARILPPLAAPAQLALLVPAGALLYGSALLLFAREAVGEAAALILRRAAA